MDNSIGWWLVGVWFGDFCKKFEVAELQPDRLVRLKAMGNESMDEWDGTEVAFSLRANGKQTLVNFSHMGWWRENGFLPHCSTKWADFMLRLKDLLEKGQGQPSPDDVQINHD